MTVKKSERRGERELFLCGDLLCWKMEDVFYLFFQNIYCGGIIAFIKDEIKDFKKKKCEEYIVVVVVVVVVSLKVQ